MATRDESLDRQEALEAAEAAHLAARTTPPDHATMDQSTARRDQPTVRLPPRPTSRAGTPARRRAPLPVAATVAALVAAMVSFLPVAVVVTLLVLAEVGPAGMATVRVAAAGWLLGHGVPLQTPDGPVSVAPLALAVLAAWRLARAGVHATRAIGARGRRSVRQAVTVAVAVAVAYGGIGTLTGLVAGGDNWGVSPVRAGLTLAGFGLLAAGSGALHATGVLSSWTSLRTAGPPAGGWRDGARALVVSGARAGLLASACVLAAGAALAGVAIAANGAAATDVLAAYRTGVAGQAGITLLCLAFAPNVAVWSTAYLLGPGFAVGTDTVVRSSEVSVGLLPVLPVFAGLPEGPLPTLGALLLVVPVVAGAVGGGLIARAVAGWWRRLLAISVAGAVAGAMLGLAAMVAGGALGDGQLAAVGPTALPVAVAATVTVTVGGLLGTFLLPRRSRPEPADPV